MQSTGYVIRPDDTIAVAQYSSGPIGSLVWQDVLGLGQHFKKSNRMSGVPMTRPDVVAFDVVGTLFSLGPVATRL